MSNDFDIRYEKFFDVCACDPEAQLAFITTGHVIAYAFFSQTNSSDDQTGVEKFLDKLVRYREANISSETRVVLRSKTDIDYDQACVQISFLKGSDIFIGKKNSYRFSGIKSIYQHTKDNEIERLFLSGLPYKSIMSLLALSIPNDEVEYTTFVNHAKKLPLELLELLYEDIYEEKQTTLLFFEKYIQEKINNKEHTASCNLNYI